MAISRREFMKICGGAALCLGFSKFQIKEALAKALQGNPPVLWIQGSGCTGCSVTLLNSVEPDIATILLKVISLKFHPTVMASADDLSMNKLFDVAKKFAGKYYLVVEGGIPTEAKGLYCLVGEYKGKELTMWDLTKRIGSKAAGVIAVGTCAAYGGIPACKPNPTGVKPVTEIFKEAKITTPVINIPGCPPHPSWIVGSLVHVLTKGIPPLDKYGRPSLFFADSFHDNCPYIKYYNEGKFAKSWEEKDACRVKLGCKGPDTNANCHKPIWNNGTNNCMDVAFCIGCTEPTFPDGESPFYEQTTG